MIHVEDHAAHCRMARRGIIIDGMTAVHPIRFQSLPTHKKTGEGFQVKFVGDLMLARAPSRAMNLG